MAQPPLSREQAQDAVDFVSKALQDGYPIKSRGGAQASAFVQGHKLYCAARFAKIAVSTFVNRVQRADSLYGILPVPPVNPAVVQWPSADTPESPQVMETRLQAKIVSQQDTINRLNRDLAAAHRENNAEDFIRSIFGQIKSLPPTPPDWLYKETKRAPGKPTPEVAMTGWADWHCGEVVDPSEVHNYNAYNKHIAAERIHRLFDDSIKLAKHHHTGNYPGIVVNCVGDMVSGGIHDELAENDDLKGIEAAKFAWEHIIVGLTMMADAFGHVFVPMVFGNHGRMTVKPQFKKYYAKNWDYVIALFVAKHFENDPRVTISFSPANDAHYRVFGIRYLLVHGDMLGTAGGDGIIGAIGPIMRGEKKKAGQSAALGLEYDQIILGHYHQELTFLRGQCCNALKGFDEYARLKLGAIPTRPTQPLWFVHPSYGITARFSVQVDEPPKPATEWLSVFAKEAA